MPDLAYPAKPRPGDRVAILSPSSGLPGLCLLAYLWQLGIVGSHGGCVMVQFGRPGAMHPDTEASLRAALFRPGEYELAPAAAYGDMEQDWADPATFASEPQLQPSGGWQWHNASRVVQGRSWGGNVEVLSWLLMAGQAIPSAGDCRGGVLLLETSEELPSAVEVYRILRSLGERGLLASFPAVLFGRPKAWSLDRRTDAEEKAAYADGPGQRITVRY